MAASISSIERSGWVEAGEGTALATALMAVSERWRWISWYFIQLLTHCPITIFDINAEILGRRGGLPGLADSVTVSTTAAAVFASVADERPARPLPSPARQPDAPAAIIHASYRTLVQRALGTTRGSEDVALLDAAYAVLGDSQRRASYDIERLWDPTPLATTRSMRPERAAHGLSACSKRDDEFSQCASPLYRRAPSVRYSADAC